MNIRHVAIVGPTASGKSWIAMELARRLPDVELVSIDSMQVYRGMDIGTAKPTLAEQAEVPHHMIDLVDPAEEFALSQFQTAALAAIADIEKRGKQAILVGGTGLYLQSVIDRLELPGQYADVRAKLEDDPNTEHLHEQLAALDPLAASRMEPNNRRRVLRALEVTIGSGRPFSSFGPGIDVFPETPFHLIGLWLPREVGAQRIERRVAEMMEQGWLEEVRLLQAQGPLSKTAAQALGYKELLSHLNGSRLDEVMPEIVNRTRSFARRQRVWFRRDPRIHWFGTETDPRHVLPAVLRECQYQEEVQGGEMRI